MKIMIKNSGRRRTGAQLVLLPAAILVAASATMWAQTAISLDEAIQQSLENNHQLQQARFDVEKADAQIDEVFGNALPSADLSANYSRNIKRPVFFFPGEDGVTRPISIGSDNSVTAELRVRQILFNGAIFNGIGTAKTYAAVSRELLRAEGSRVVADVKTAYYGALLADAVLRVNQQLLDNAEKNYRNASLMYEQGVRAEFDVVRARVQVANIKPRIVQATNARRLAMENLALVLGLEGSGDIALSDTLALPEIDEEYSIEQANVMLDANNAQLEAARQSIEVQRQAIAVNRSDYLPTLALFGSYQYQAQADEFSGLEFQPTVVAGLSLSMNLLNGGQTKAKVEQARIDYLSAMEQYEEAHKAMTIQVEGAIRKLELAREQYAAGREGLEQAERAVDIASVGYRAGTGTLLEINDAETARMQAQLNNLNAIHDYNVALAELEQLVGDDISVSEDAKNVRYEKAD